MSTLKEKAEQILQEKEEKIIAENIKKDVTIYNVTGSLQEGTDTSDATATANDIARDETAYVNGQKIIGTIWDNRKMGENITVTNHPTEPIVDIGNDRLAFKGKLSTAEIFDENNVIILENYNTDIANHIGLTAEKIKKDETILGVTGTYESSGGGNTFGPGEVFMTRVDDNNVTLDNNYNEVQFRLPYEESFNTTFIQGGTIGLAAFQSAVATAAGLTAEKIKQGETILGITGTYEGGGSATSINTTLNFQVGETSGSSDIEYMTYENFKQATFDLTQLYNWNRNNGNGTPISQTILEMPYVYLHIGYIHQSYELEAGIEVDYKFVATSKPIVSRVDEYDSVTQMAKDCYYYEISNGFFTNVENNPDTGEDYVPEERNYTTFEEFWTDFCNTIYEETSYRCVKPKGISDYSISSYAEDGYLFSNV